MHHYHLSWREGYVIWSGPVINTTTKDGKVFRGKRKLCNRSPLLTGWTNVCIFLIDLIVPIRLRSNFHNKICIIWVSAWQIVFDLGNIHVIRVTLAFEYQQGRRCLTTRDASVAGVLVDNVGPGAADSCNNEKWCDRSSFTHSSPVWSVFFIVTDIKKSIRHKGYRRFHLRRHFFLGKTSKFKTSAADPPHLTSTNHLQCNLANNP